MSPDAEKWFIEHFERLDRLVTEGKLPDPKTTGVRFHQRLAYVGHKVLHGIYQPAEDRHYRCVACMSEWDGETIFERRGQKYRGGICPKCGLEDLPTYGHSNVFQLNVQDLTKWECLGCKHQWIAEEGETCPECNLFWRDFKPEPK